MELYESKRAVIADDGSFHYGLIRTPSEKTFAMGAALLFASLPTVDIDKLPESQGIASWQQIEDQEQQGSCTGQARTQGEEISYWRQTEGQVIQYSRQFAYITGQKKSGISGDRGATMEGSAGAAVETGSCLESLAPYTGKYYTQFSREAYENAEENKTEAYVRLENYEQVLQWQVYGIGGVTIGIGWNSSMEPDGQGRVESYRGGGGGHALCLSDWNRKFADSMRRPYLVMDNSWGKRWGLNGRAFISPKVVDWWCKNETVLGYSKLKIRDIKPKSFDWITQSFWG
jgi:C1A family cysteine protease